MTLRRDRRCALGLPAQEKLSPTAETSTCAASVCNDRRDIEDSMSFGAPTSESEGGVGGCAAGAAGGVGPCDAAAAGGVGAAPFCASAASEAEEGIGVAMLQTLRRGTNC